MGKPLRPQQSLYLDEQKADMLDALSKGLRVPKQVLLREAVDDLLEKYAWHRKSTIKPKPRTGK